MAKTKVQKLNSEEDLIKVSKTRETKIKRELLRLEQEIGYLTPRDIVQSAKSPSSPLHNTFDWNDTTAADKYRIVQARMLLTRIRINLEGENAPAFVNVKVIIGNVESNRYISTEKAMSDEEMSRQVIAQAIREVEYWQDKYDSLTEVKSVINGSKLKTLKKKLI